MIELLAVNSFVRLLKASKPTRAVREAIERLERVFDEAIDAVKQHIGFDAFEVIDCDRLAKVQLGSGLIALNSLLEKQTNLINDGSVMEVP